MQTTGMETQGSGHIDWVEGLGNWNGIETHVKAFWYTEVLTY